ncbi:LPS export ABC transporter periplasmic protein LptC [Prosthecochloris sp. GSB1]|uniref:LPS export ABC transporter periplasmic protein LptC n=1 Tax=Prosthecochloris sp. GSB1 TaxID=281093 RepID=UPI000B8CD205|nr:LPS export ABC transporter periplasmic protein LptC [Prosthecochloris sp. GSB1]ASQ89874.1 LPS export ABC transporter periplasmic protein LptC [Prosthecochloris sp. GSB1]
MPRCIGRILLSCLTICLFGCATPPGGERAADTRFLGEDQPVQESWNITMKIFREDKIQAVVNAGHFAEYKKKDIITRHLDDGVVVVFHDSAGKPSSRLTAERGIIHDGNDMEAFGNVVIHSGDSTVINTEYIKRFGKDRRLWSDKYVTVRKPGETIRGYGFESDEALKNYTIFNASGEAEANR